MIPLNHPDTLAFRHRPFSITFHENNQFHKSKGEKFMLTSFFGSGIQNVAGHPFHRLVVGHHEKLVSAVRMQLADSETGDVGRSDVDPTRLHVVCTPVALPLDVVALD